MLHAKIIGTGASLPARIVSNDELAAQLADRGVETSDQWIVERTGIRQRHVITTETTTSLAVAAAEKALLDAGLAAQDVGLIVVATSTSENLFPSTACQVQAALGCPQAAAFDVQAACTGFIYALAAAEGHLRAGRTRHALVIGAETFSTILDWNDRRTCILFGDGAGAVVLAASSGTATGPGPDVPGIRAIHLGADGSQGSILYAQAKVSHGQVAGDPFVRMDGQAVFKQAVQSLSQSAQTVCRQAGVTLADLDWLVPHQANVRIINFLGRKLGLDAEKIVITLDKHANTSAASVPLALDAARRDGRIQAGQLVLMQGVGAGFTWGSALVRM